MGLWPDKYQAVVRESVGLPIENELDMTKTEQKKPEGRVVQIPVKTLLALCLIVIGGTMVVAGSAIEWGWEAGLVVAGVLTLVIGILFGVSD